MSMHITKIESKETHKTVALIFRIKNGKVVMI